LREEGEHSKLRADSGLISLSITIFIIGMAVYGVLFLPMITSTIKVQVQVFAAYVITASLVMLAVVGVTSVFRKKI
jgi:ABC-type nickel/cobalt efflux system permease component RcnA